MKLTIQERTRLSNAYRREASQMFQCASPFRQNEYIKFRLRGMTPEKAIARVRQKGGR